MISNRRQCFLMRQRRGRLIHDDDARLECQRAGDIHELLNRRGELANDRIDRCRTAEQRPDLFGPEALRAAIDQARQPICGLVAEHDVLRHRQFGDNGAFLVNHRDTVILGGRHAGQRYRRAVDADLTTVRCQRTGQHLDEGAFAGTVFTNDSMHLAVTDREIDPIDGTNFNERFVQFGGLKHGGRRSFAPVHHAAPRPWTTRRAAPD